MADGGRQYLHRHLNDAKSLQKNKAAQVRDAVKLPRGEDMNEWLAVNVNDFFNQVSMLYGTITEHCTDYSCPAMTAGPKFEYAWTENDQLVQCKAPVYIDYLFSSIQDELDDETVFPSQIAKPFPPDFIEIVKTIMKRLFRVYAHIYHHHHEQIKRLKSLEHFHLSFQHFIFFIQEFGLMKDSDLEPLHDLIHSLVPSIPFEYSTANGNGNSTSSSQS